MMILITLIMIITPIAGKGKKKKNREWIVSEIDKVWERDYAHKCLLCIVMLLSLSPSPIFKKNKKK